MLLLEENKKVEFERKIKIASDFLNEFSNNCGANRFKINFLQRFNIEEILTDDFFSFYTKFETCFEYTSYNRITIVLDALRYVLYQQRLFENPDNIILAIIDGFKKKYYEVSENYYNDYIFNTISKIIELNKEKCKLKSLDVLYELYVNNIAGFRKPTAFLDNIIMSAETTAETLTSIKEKFPSYNKLSLAILNPIISDSEKIKILKSNYRKKDFPQYKKYFIESKNLEMITLFVKATVLENGRIQDKENSIIEIFRSLFITTDYFRFIGSNCIEKDKFISEFKHYFEDPDFVFNLYTRIADSTNRNSNYRNKDNFKELVKLIFNINSNMEREDVIKILKISQFYVSLFNKYSYGNILYPLNYKLTLDETLDIIKNWIKTAKKISYSNLVLTFTGFINDGNGSISLTDAFENNSLKEINNANNLLADGIISDCFLNKSFEFIKLRTTADSIFYLANNRTAENATLFTLLMRPKYLLNENFIKDKYIQTLGFDYEEFSAIENEKNIYYNKYTLEEINKFINFIYTLLDAYLENETITKEDFENIKNRYFKLFENSDEIDILTENVFSLGKLKYFKKLTPYSYGNSSKDTLDAAIELMEKVREIGCKYYDKTNDSNKNIFITSIDDGINTLKLTQAF